MYQLHKTIQESQKEFRARDGSIVAIRHISYDDGESLRSFFSRLSPETIYSRYLSCKRGYSETEVKHICNIETGIRMALVAEIEIKGNIQIVGLAEYDMVKPGMAEVGIVVEDEFQGLGIATHMLKELVNLALEEEIKIFSASVHPLNSRILNFVRKSNLPVEKHMTYGAWEIQVELAGIH